MPESWHFPVTLRGHTQGHTIKLGQYCNFRTANMSLMAPPQDFAKFVKVAFFRVLQHG